MNFKRIISILLSLTIVLNGSIVNFATSNDSNSTLESSENKNQESNDNNKQEVSEKDIAIVNYLAVKTYELSKNKENYVELDNIQSLIRNSISIDSLKNEDTHNFVINDFLPTITNLKLDDKSRARATELLNERKANAITKGALATAEAMTSIDTSNVAGGIVGGIGAAGVGVATYIDAIQLAETEINDKNLELIKSAISNIDKINIKLLDYMINMSKNKGITDKQLMTETDIKEFYDAKVSKNIRNKIDLLKRVEKKLSVYGPYWLELSRAYYQRALEEEADGNNADNYYKEAAESFEKYEKLDNSIYKEGKNIEYYKSLPIYIESIEKIKPSEYVNIAEKHTKMLELLYPNDENWDSNLYLVTLYEKLYDKTNNKKYLESAYDIMKILAGKLTTSLKEKNMSIKHIDGQYEYDNAVIMSLSKLKSLSDKLNKNDTERLELDKYIFGNDKKIFYNIWLDSALAFSEENQDLYKQIKGEKEFDSEKIVNEIRVYTEKAKIEVNVNKELLTSPYDVRFLTRSKNTDIKEHWGGDENSFAGNQIAFIINDNEAKDLNIFQQGCTEAGGKMLIEIHFPSVLGLGEKTLDILYNNPDGFNKGGFKFHSAELNDNEVKQD